MKLFILALVALCLVPLSSALADDQIYTWTDENGRTQASPTKPDGWTEPQYQSVETQRQEQEPLRQEQTRDVTDAQRKAADQVQKNGSPPPATANPPDSRPADSDNPMERGQRD